MKGKALVIGVICLLLGVIVVSAGNTPEKHTTSIQLRSITHTSNDGTTLYVGGTGPGNYTHIQDAIDNASDGDTVYVYNGAYYENVVVDKSIDLIGENVNNTIIKADYHVVTIDASGVNIEGFTIKGGSVGIAVNSDHNRISRNYISECEYWGIGMKFSYCSSNTITENTILNNYGGIYLISGANDNIITGNNISSNEEFGIRLYKSNNNIISDNTFFDCGLFLQYSWENIVYNNTVNDRPLVYLDGESDISIIGDAGQIILLRCDNITIQSQDLSNLAVAIQLWDTDNCLISNNIVSYTTWYGIELLSSSNNTISGNNILNNQVIGGIYLDSSNNNTISGNKISNSGNGIFFASSNSNIISGNTLTNNEIGINFYRRSSNNNIYHNNFIKNNIPACFLDSIGANNNWNKNYWNRGRIFPKPIFGGLVIVYTYPYPTWIPWIKFDCHPLIKPYGGE